MKEVVDDHVNFIYKKYFKTEEISPSSYYDERGLNLSNLNQQLEFLNKKKNLINDLNNNNSSF